MLLFMYWFNYPSLRVPPPINGDHQRARYLLLKLSRHTQAEQKDGADSERTPQDSDRQEKV